MQNRGVAPAATPVSSRGVVVEPKNERKVFSPDSIFGAFAIVTMGTAAFSTVGVVTFGGRKVKEGSFTAIIDRPLPRRPVSVNCVCLTGEVSLQSNGRGTVNIVCGLEGGENLPLKFQIVVTGARPSGEVTSFRAIQEDSTLLGGLNVFEVTKIVRE